MNLTNCLLFFLIGATLAFCVSTFKQLKEIDTKLETYVDATTESGKAMLEVVKRTRAFEATGFEADVTDDGRIKIVFLRKVASKEEDDSKKEGMSKKWLIWGFQTNHPFLHHSVDNKSAP